MKIVTTKLNRILRSIDECMNEFVYCQSVCSAEANKCNKKNKEIKKAKKLCRKAVDQQYDRCIRTHPNDKPYCVKQQKKGYAKCDKQYDHLIKDCNSIEQRCNKQCEKEYRRCIGKSEKGIKRLFAILKK